MAAEAAVVAGVARAGGRARGLRRRHEVLGSLLAMADFTTPRRFLETILSGPIDGRRKLYRRLGLAARDPIDELLVQRARVRAQRNAVARPLPRLVFARRRRDPARSLGAGQRGPGDDRSRRQGARSAVRDPRRCDRRSGEARRTYRAHRLPWIWRGRCRWSGRARPSASAVRPDHGATSEQRDLEEHWRLLYVGLTRASRAAGGRGRRAQGGAMAENSWHTRVERALAALGARGGAGCDVGRGDALLGQRPRGSAQAQAAAPAIDPAPIPEWARTRRRPKAGRRARWRRLRWPRIAKLRRRRAPSNAPRHGAAR